MEETINVTIRKERGTSASKRLRKNGLIPAVLYGHGEETVSLSVPAIGVDTAIRHGSRVVELRGDVTETAFIRDVQWDTFGIDVLHVDFTRVSASEVVRASVELELKGEAPGVKEGGVVEHVTHTLEIDMPVNTMVDRLGVSINELHLGQQLTAGDLNLPEGAVVPDASVVIAQCVEPKAESDEAMDVDGSVEPEVIGQKKDEAEGE